MDEKQAKFPAHDKVAQVGKIGKPKWKWKMWVVDILSILDVVQT